jgi:serine/threonine protein kinase
MLGERLNLEEKLGAGAFGQVIRGVDEHGAQTAVKKIPMNADGLPCLMEASLMATVRHPYINSAKLIHTDPKNLYIIQDLATTDLSKYIREVGPPSPETLRLWTWSLVKAVQWLHLKDLIHADIKAANVLLFSSGGKSQVKLNDFTLTIKKWHSEQKFRHNICTATHRPLEVWLGRDWDESVDIWSLACTLYEIAYGQSLFPYQVEGLTHPEGKQAHILRDRSIDALLEWAARDPIEPQAVKVSRRGTKIVTPTVSQHFYEPAYVEFNDLILAMLRVNAEERPTIVEILQHPYFKPMAGQRLVSQFLAPPEVKLSPLFQTKVTRLLQQYHQTPEAVTVTMALLARCQQLFATLNETQETIYILSVMWMASKLVHRLAFDVGCNQNEVLAVERVIATHLAFRLL